ncbi:DUF1904 domain-containing protein [Clostridium swellfunianum]|uniref:DUF1904 domain-containing protein n=1 Tax=Clostridium swellfunianum TaxID=1367462 RepID=UPI0020306A67|nr:DUF1904 domain-containing protein [Clostridium swellfunianum]MCM0647002.1 DUF1904 domain-containing protein [Clostridium swellfunianum]
MPQIRFRAIETKGIQKISKEMVDELEQLLKCPRDYFSLEVINSTFINDGEIVQGNPVVEVHWFDRGQEIQDKAAQIITKYIQAIELSNVDVIFTKLEESMYYENGVHF